MVLQYLGLVEYGVRGPQLKRAALLLFAKDITRWHPRCEIRIIRVSGTTVEAGRQSNVTGEDIIHGNIVKLLSDAWDELRPHLAVKRLSGGGLWAETVLYPEDACVEALINAVAHRDYSMEGKPIEVFLFDDRLEVRSPGELLSPVTVADLKRLTRAHQSRNPYVSRVLREFEYMRELGEGIPRIFQAMAARDLSPPEITSEAGSFAITLFHRSVFSPRDQLWLESYRSFSPSTDEQRVLLLGGDGHLLSYTEIRQALKIADTEDYRKIIESMTRKGLIYSARPVGSRGPGERAKLRRFALRPLGELEYFFQELTKALRSLSPCEQIGRTQLESIRRRLSPRSPYAPSTTELVQSLRYLGFTDQQGQALDPLKALWRIRS